MPRKRKAPCDDGLVSLHAQSHLSQSALECVLKSVRERGLPQNISRASQTRERQRFCQALTPYGAVVQQLDVGEHRFWVNHPIAHLYRTAAHCDRFVRILKSTWQRRPCNVASPWRIITYFDEVSPTDPKSVHEDDKKIQCIYWTFLEFAPYIHDERVWFIIACIPRVDICALGGGMAELFSRLLSTTFFNPNSISFDQSGIMLDFDGAAQRLFAKHHMCLLDFAAIQQLLGCMGPNGLRACPACSNVVKDNLVVMKH